MIHLSPTAICEINRLQRHHAGSNCFLRLDVQPGGCASLSYTVAIDTLTSDNDQVFTCNDVKVIVAIQSLKYLDGLTLDYSEDLMGGAFRFHNPNAQENCGCGNSFSVAE